MNEDLLTSRDIEASGVARPNTDRVVRGNEVKKSRNALSATDRRLICELKQLQPEWSNPQVAEEASKLLNRPVVRNTVCRVLAESDKWLNTPESEGHKKKERKPKWENLEAHLLAYHQEATSRGEAVKGAQLRDKAKELATILAVEDFKCSPGWMDNFKRRNHLKKERAGHSPSKAQPLAAQEGGHNDVLRPTETPRATPRPTSYRTKRRKQDMGNPGKAEKLVGNLTALLVSPPDREITTQTEFEVGAPPPDETDQQNGHTMVDDALDSGSDLLVTQDEATAAAKLLLAFFSERPNMAAEDHRAMRQIASAITKQNRHS